MKTIQVVLRFFHQPTINSDKYEYHINNTIFTIILFLMIFKYFYHMCNNETFPRNLIKDFELKLQ